MLRLLTGQIEGLSVAETIVAGILPRAGVCYRRPGPRLQRAAGEQDAEQQRKNAFRAGQLPSIFHSPLLLCPCVSLSCLAFSPVFHGFLPCKLFCPRCKLSSFISALSRPSLLRPVSFFLFLMSTTVTITPVIKAARAIRRYGPPPSNNRRQFFDDSLLVFPFVVNRFEEEGQISPHQPVKATRLPS